MSEQRKYSLDEIDRMRRAIFILSGYGGSENSIIFRREEELRTYMLNGTTPEELELAVETEWGCPISGINTPGWRR